MRFIQIKNYIYNIKNLEALNKVSKLTLQAILNNNVKNI